MVAVPVSVPEHTSLNVTEANYNGKLDQIDAVKAQHQILRTIAMSLGKDNPCMTFNGTMAKETTKLNLPTDNLEPEPTIVKKIAAGLISGPVMNGLSSKEQKEICLDVGSLSSGSSIVTIVSVPNSDQDSEFPNDNGDKPPKKQRLIMDESCFHTTLQVSVPFFIAGIGTIGAGLVLSNVQHWDVFKNVSQIFILVPALLGLKGNLDMCLASRLSTQANLGNMKGFREIGKMVIGNVALVQVQAIVAALLVAMFAISVGALTSKEEFNWNYSLLLIASSICTATSSCFILDFVMIAVIMGSYRMRMNPDNLATPLAASIGDVVSISVLSRIAQSLYDYLLEDKGWILYVLVGLFVVLLPFWVFIVLKNKYTKKVLTSGWTPVISALFISGLGGLILDQAVGVLKGFVIFQPIINGIGGNLVSVQASRISTMLHQTSIMGIVPPHTKMLVSPITALFNGVPSAKTARILIIMSIPGHLAFTFAADYIQWFHSTMHVYFVLSYLIVAVLQVMILLYVAHIMIHAMWRYKIDPDNSAIPYLTALGDLLGSILLAAAFFFLREIHHEYGEYTNRS